MISYIFSNAIFYSVSILSFNTVLSKTRVHVECVFGMMKRKFSCLDKGLQYQPEAVVNIIKACVFLWNYGLLKGGNKGYDPAIYVPEDADEFDASLSATYSG